MDMTLADLPMPVIWIIGAFILGLAIAPPFLGRRSEHQEPPDDLEIPTDLPSGEPSE